MIIDEEAYLAHYGILRKSGRYPWGSGNNQSTRNRIFLDTISDLRKQGLSDAQIGEGFGLSSTQIRAARSIANNEQKQLQIATAQKLKTKGLSNVAIGKKMGINESSVRALLAEGEKEKADILQTTSNMLKDQVDKKGLIDIGAGVEHHVGVSKTNLNVAVAMLKEKGYETHTIEVVQLGTGLKTKVKVLAPPGTTLGEVMKNRDNIKQVTDFSDDGGRTFFGIVPPIGISADRVGVKYAEDGGSLADGVIYVRPGVQDVHLGKANYAQVRILVNDSHYLKGMAMYKDDLPEGIDLMFNTNKSNTGNKLDALKAVTGDPDNPFGAEISRQIGVKDSTGKLTKLTSVMNIVNEEGDWGDWSRSLSTQMLSKQSTALAKAQLKLTYEQRLKSFELINSLTNQTVRKKLLESFGDATEAASVHLKAAALPRQSTHAILPIQSLPPTQIYAPNFKDGERVVLIRYPHGGTFEIPELTVNNKHPESKKLLGNAKDAVGIHPSVAERLSGADFDGDTVLVIPNNSGKITVTAALDGLKNFDPRSQYKAYDGMPRMSAKTKQTKMGEVSNLITDMTIMGAPSEHIARAVRHSMVVIDAEKHHLNYKQSEIDNGIVELKRRYQLKADGKAGGASTIISRATSEIRVPERRPRKASEGGAIDKVTGKRVFVETGKSYTNKQGKLVRPTTRSEKLAETEDAFSLVSGGGVGTPMERLYAEHSNKLKVLANLARKESVNTPRAPYSSSARKTYSAEVASLKSKLALAERNAPLERQAQLFANAIVKQKQHDNPDMDEARLKKVKSQALNAARQRTGAKKQRIEFTEREWQAIQAGAISDSQLSAMLENADMDNVISFAAPKTSPKMTTSKSSRAQAMLDLGYTRAEVADQLGVSLSTLDAVTDVKGVD